MIILGTGASALSNDKGYFENEAALVAAYPVGEPGWFATVGTTDTVWVWDADTTAWVDTHQAPDLSAYWKSDGSSAAAGNWNLGSFTIVAGNLSGTNTGDQDLSGYWKSDGSSTATGNWNLGTNSVTAEDFNTSDGHGFHSEESSFFTEGADLYIKNSATDKNVYLNINDGGTEKTALFIDGRNAYVGILNTSPQYELDLGGKFHASKDIITDGEFGAGMVTKPEFMFDGASGENTLGLRLTIVNEFDPKGFTVHRRARGGEYGSPDNTRDGDVLGGWQGWGYYNRDYRHAVGIEFRREGEWERDDYPSLIAFRLAPRGSASTKDHVILNRSALMPAEDNVVDLGAKANNWKDLYVKGTAFLGSLKVGSLSAQSGNLLTNNSGAIGTTTNKLYWNETNGYLGIGTNEPAKPLHIASTSANIRLEDTAAGGATWQFASNDGNFKVRDVSGGFNTFTFETGAPSNSFYVDSSGNVGFGTATPGAAIHVANATNPTVLLQDTTNNVMTGFSASDTSGTIGTASNHAFNVITNGVQRMRFNTSGNVGINTTSPATTLDVNGVITATGGNSTQWNTAYTHSQDNSQAHSDYLTNNGNDETSGRLIAPNFVSSGNNGHPTGIGYYVETYMYGDVGRLFCFNGSAYGDLAIGDWNGGDPNIMLKVGGNVGIGTGTPTTTLDVNGAITARGGGSGQSIIASGLVVNEGGGGTAADSLRVETNLISNAFLVDAVNDTVNINTGVRVRVTRVTSNTTLNNTYHHVFVDTNAGDVNITLPAGESGAQYIIYNCGTSGNVVTIIPNGTDEILGENSNYDVADGDDEMLTFETTEHWR